MKLIVGLGNPGRAYAQTRHNAGWLVLDEIARRYGAVLRRSWRRPVQSAKVSQEGREPLLLAKPLTYMNRSGTVLRALMRSAGLTAKDLIVVTDDVNLPLGKMRIRPGGSAGGHNGMKSVIEHLGSETFVRVRIGVGEQEQGQHLKDHVLERMSAGDRQVLADTASRAAEAVDHLLTHSVDSAMNQYN
ncbi:MAG: aminoacyl-tRNA hydrolase [Kiritimatiellae bacterium]|nr:aminoacyl-tRNA hydrolase [Kiritimatiellia bacterium]MDD4341837.1 aminoacyl-tRNA hydrolase [Kiritimatiellia bacterium]